MKGLDDNLLYPTTFLNTIINFMKWLARKRKNSGKWSKRRKKRERSLGCNRKNMKKLSVKTLNLKFLKLNGWSYKKRSKA